MTGAGEFRPGGSGNRDRSIRVFISSTFLDMQEEREQLVKHTFLELRKLCESRGVTWSEVDLRWGITDEQKAEGRVLPICLAEIHNCRPFFIGILGERYGWVPDDLPPEAIEREPWLAEHLERSVTELEILHGVLNNPSMAEHAFFYFRDPAYVDSVPAEHRWKYREGPSPREIERYGEAEAQRRAGERRDRLVALKDRIRASAFPVVEDYADPKALGRRVFHDLEAVIDGLYPAGTEPAPLDRETMAHEAFIRSRAGVYIGRSDYFERLDAHVMREDPPLTVVGDPGSGKSALLANWVLERRAEHPDVPVVAHFVGASGAGGDWEAMLRRILGELDRTLGPLDVPEEAAVLRTAFARGLRQAGARGPAVLVIDGLNQLEDRDGALDLSWLPDPPPVDVRIILSTLAGRPLDELRRRGAPTLEVAPLDVEERRRLIDEYLAQYRKTLSPEHASRIAAATQSSNPLYLRSLLEELRLWGEHETLEHRVRHYLRASSPPELFDRILQRWEEDYDHRPGLVANALSLLWTAREGLSRAELLDLLGEGDEPLPGAYWSPLYLAAEASLVERSGLLDFSHAFIRQAVASRYLKSERARRRLRLRIADYFDSRGRGWRRLKELPWQLSRAEAWDRLGPLLADPSFFDTAWKTAEWDVREYWALLESRAGWRIADAYRDLIDDPGSRPWTARMVANLLGDAGHERERSELLHRYVEAAGAWDDPRLLGDALAMLGHSYLVEDEYERAMELHRRAEEVLRDAGHHGGVALALASRADVFSATGDHRAAERLLAEAEPLLRRGSDRANLGILLSKRANLSLEMREPATAVELAEEAARIHRELGIDDALAGALHVQGRALARLGRGGEALQRLESAEEIYRHLGDRPGLAGCLNSRAGVMISSGDREGGLALLDEAEAIHRALADRRELGVVLFNQAFQLKKTAETRERAREKLEEARRIFQDLGLPVEANRARAELLQLRGGKAPGAALLLLTLAAVAGSLLWTPWLWILVGALALAWIQTAAMLLVPGYREALERWLRQATAEERWERHERER